MTNPRNLESIRLLAALLLAACAPTNAVVGRAPESPTREPSHDAAPTDSAKRAKDIYRRRQNEADAAGPRVVEVDPATMCIGTVTTHRFHRPSCALVKGVPTAEQIRFTTAWDALNNNYRPCEECAPMK